MSDPANPVVRVIVVDDHPAMRGGIVGALRSDPSIDIVGEASDGADAISLVQQIEPQVVLMDLSMPGMGGVEATRKIVKLAPNVTVIVLSSHSDLDHVRGALDAGARGYLLKDADPAELVRGIHAAAVGGSPVDPRVARIVLDDRRGHSAIKLTEREREVLAAIADGLPNKLIARRLGIAEKTVKAHLTRIFQELDVSDRTQAVLRAVRDGLVPPRT